MMRIYKAEADIKDLILNSKSIAYTCPVIACDSDATLISRAKALKATASANDSDLFYTRYVLVSSNWNLNDDIFEAEELWAARHTPVHKPSNLNHNESKIVGHITDGWAIDADGNILSDDLTVDELPSLFHLVNGGVIYKNWEDDELHTRATTLIDAIIAGTKYVSMECLFTDFDYGVMSSDGSHTIIQRNKSTAHLTKVLRCFGGSGIYNGKRIGRVLRNITFCGKGYVDKPANIHSIILSPDTSVADNNNSNPNFTTDLDFSGVSNINTNNNISMENNMPNDTITVDNASSELETLTKANEELSTKLTEITTAYEAKLLDLNAKFVDLQTEAVKNKEEKDTMKTKCEELEAKIVVLTQENTALALQVADIKANEVKASRIALLVGAGMTQDMAGVKAESFASLTDEQFSAVIDALAAITPAVNTESTQTDVIASVDTVIDDTTKALDSVVSDGVTLASTDDTLNTTADDNFNKLSNTIASMFASKVKNRNKK